MTIKKFHPELKWKETITDKQKQKQNKEREKTNTNYLLISKST